MCLGVPIKHRLETNRKKNPRPPPVPVWGRCQSGDKKTPSGVQGSKKSGRDRSMCRIKDAQAASNSDRSIILFGHNPAFYQSLMRNTSRVSAPAHRQNYTVASPRPPLKKGRELRPNFFNRKNRPSRSNPVDRKGSPSEAAFKGRRNFRLL
jgi:hypothetical protein